MSAFKSRCSLAALALFALAALAVAALPSASAAVPGFTVTGDTSFERTTLVVEGQITVADGGTLSLDAVDLVLVPSATQPAALVVEKGGTLLVKDSVIQAGGPSPREAVRIEIRGSARISTSTLKGLASDDQSPPSEVLGEGFRIAPGGLLVRGSDVVLEEVAIRNSAGCAVTVTQASPTLRGLDVSGVSYRISGGEGFAAAVCVAGGSPSIEGLTVANIGDKVGAGSPVLFSAGLLADTPVRLTLKDIDARSFAPALAGQSAPSSVAVLVRNPAFVNILGGRIEGSSFGIVMRGSSAPSTGGSVAIEQLSIVNTPSGPVSVTAAYSSDPNLVWSGLDITGCGSNGFYFESQNAGTTNAVTATVSNVTARSCGLVGINMFDNGAQGPHYFNVWDSNASLNGREGFYLHGQGLGGGLNVQMANNAAWRNQWAGIRVEAAYNAGGAAKLASAKLEYNTADNNSLSGGQTISGGITLILGAPSTMSLRYLYNVAHGNGVASGVTDYGHYIQVAVSNSMTIGTGYMTGIVAEDNGDYGIGLVGGAGLASRLDQARIRDCRVLNQPIGTYGVNARIEMWNCTMFNPTEFSGDLTGIYVMGGSHNRLTGTTTGLYKIVAYHRICLHGEWQNGAPLYVVPLSFTSGTNNSAAGVYGDVSTDPPAAAGNRQTDANGNWTGWVLDWIYDPQATPSSSQRQDFAPLTISAQVFETSAKLAPFDLTADICGPFTFTDPNTPSLIINSPRENGTYTRSSLTIQGSASDDLSGLAGVEISLGGTVWITIAGPWSPFSYAFNNLSDGFYDLYLRAWDRASDGLDPRAETLVVLYSITIDTVAPVLNIIDPPVSPDGDYYTQNDNILFRGSVDPSVRELYVNGIFINITGTAFLYLGPLPNEGPQSFLFLAVDGAGNARNLTVTIYKDKVDPTLIIVLPPARGTIYVSSHSLYIEGITDPNTNVTINGAQAALSGVVFSTTVALTEGVNIVNITAVDQAGNRAARLLTVISDTVAPTITLASPLNNEFLNSSRVDLVGTLSETVEFLEVNLRIFSVAGTDFDALLGLAEGRNGIWINATDRAGNIGQAHIELTIDTVAPQILLFGLLDDLVVNTNLLPVTGAVTEEAVVTVDGQPVDLISLGFDTAVSLTEGSNTFEILATDRAGNRASLLRHVTLDTVDPTISVTGPSDGATVHSNTVLIEGTSEPFATVQVGSQFVEADATGHFSAWVTLPKEGPNAIQIKVTDAAGNSLSQSTTVTYAPEAVSTGGDLPLGLVLLAALAAGAAGASWFLARRRVEGEVEEAQVRRRSDEESQRGTPGYTEQPQPQEPYGALAEATPQAPLPEAPYGAAPEGAGYAEAPAPEGAPAPPRAPRAPRPPRPPSN